MKNGWIIVVQQDPLQMTIDELLLLLNFTKFFRLLHRSGNDPLVIVLRIGEIKTLVEKIFLVILIIQVLLVVFVIIRKMKFWLLKI